MPKPYFYQIRSAEYLYFWSKFLPHFIRVLEYPLTSYRSLYSRWRGIGEQLKIEEKMFEKTQFTSVNEYFEAIFDKDIERTAISRQ